MVFNKKEKKKLDSIVRKIEKEMSNLVEINVVESNKQINVYKLITEYEFVEAERVSKGYLKEKQCWLGDVRKLLNNSSIDFLEPVVERLTKIIDGQISKIENYFKK